MSDTPRTAAVLAELHDRDGELSFKNAPMQWVQLARELERERDRLHSECENLIGVNAKKEEDIAALVKERDALKAAGDVMAKFISTSATEPVENWPTDSELDAALANWRSASGSAPAQKGQTP